MENLKKIYGTISAIEKGNKVTSEKVKEDILKFMAETGIENFDLNFFPLSFHTAKKGYMTIEVDNVELNESENTLVFYYYDIDARNDVMLRYEDLESGQEVKLYKKMVELYRERMYTPYETALKNMNNWLNWTWEEFFKTINSLSKLTQRTEFIVNADVIFNRNGEIKTYFVEDLTLNDDKTITLSISNLGKDIFIDEVVRGQEVWIYENILNHNGFIWDKE